MPLMIVRTSAKSTLMRPGTVIRSLMPCTALSSTESALRNASTIEVCVPTSASSRLLGITISVSTAVSRRSMPSIACRARFLPSKPNGLVTTPTVSAPQSRAIWAITGAAPVPVPPPMPAVTNTMSAPAIRSAMLLHALLGGAPADLGVGAGAQALGQRVAELDLVRRHVGFQRLHVGVRDDELDAVQVAADHGVDRVAAAATDADDEDLRVTDVVEFDECHGLGFSPGRPI